MVTRRSPFCGYNTTQCVRLNGEGLPCDSNKIESVCLRKCPYDDRLTNKAYLRAIAVTNISKRSQQNRRRCENRGVSGEGVGSGEGMCPFPEIYEFFISRSQQKSTGIDVQQNYATVTLVGALVAWHSGITSVSDWRTFPVVRSTCSGWVTTNGMVWYGKCRFI